jgi:hypothetical protein
MTSIKTLSDLCTELCDTLEQSDKDPRRVQSLINRSRYILQATNKSLDIDHQINYRRFTRSTARNSELTS